MSTLFAALLALLIDFLLGEPKRWHPLIGFGKWVDYLEQCLNKTQNHPTIQFLMGTLAWLLAVMPIVLIIMLLDNLLGAWAWLLSILCGWLAIGWYSLRQHAQWVQHALEENDIDQAREKVGWIVSRDTSQLSPQAISCASIESVLENGSDAIFAPLFWLAIGGAPLVILYRLSNTLDAMWGYRNTRYEQFGKTSARIDDLLNYIPARLCALSYALAGHFGSAIKAWKMQGHLWYSPNAGVVMATGAGALQLQLGGDAIYHGQMKSRPSLGLGEPPNVPDLARAIQLIDRSVLIWAALFFILALVGYF